jgi:hypothetical protein
MWMPVQLSDSQKADIITSHLAQLPYFGGDMAKHIHFEIRYDGDTSTLIYKIISDLKNQRSAVERIHIAMTNAAIKAHIPAVLKA